MSKKEEIEKLEEEIRLQELRLKKKKLDDEENQMQIAEDTEKVKDIFKIIIIMAIAITIFIGVIWLVGE